MRKLMTGALALSVLGFAALPGTALAHHPQNANHNPPGQVCKADEIAPGPKRGECASAAAAANKEAREEVPLEQ